MTDPNLYILRADGTWIKIFDLKYKNVYSAIQTILKSFEGKGSDVNGCYKNHVIFSNSDITVTCLYNESHRLCSILACIQYDRTTNTQTIEY